MVRQYKRKNAIVRGSRLTTDTTANILLLYLYGIPTKRICAFFKVSEPAAHRIIRKFQERLLSDRELLEHCLNLQASNDEARALFSPMLDAIQSNRPEVWSGLYNCLFVCGNKVVGDVRLIETYVKNLEGDDSDFIFSEEIDDELIFHIRDDWCRNCGNILKNDLDIQVFNIILATNSHRSYVSPNTMRLHFPAMLIRAMASTLSRHSKGAGNTGIDYKDMLSDMWSGGINVLCKRPL